MCKIGNSAVIIPNQYVKTEKKNKENKVICPTPETAKRNDSVKVNSKESKNKVTHSVQIDDFKPTKGEKVINTAGSIIGNTQDALDVSKKLVTAGQAAAGTGAIAKITRAITPAIKVVTSLRGVDKIDKLVNNPVANKALGFLSIVGGGFQMRRGFKEIKKGEHEKGGFNIAGGAATVVMGGALVFGAAPVAAAAGAVGLGITVVKYGSGSVKKLGWLKSKDGKDQSTFERLGERSTDAQKAVQKRTGSKALGYVAKVGSSIAMVPVATVVSVGGAVVQGGKTVGGAVSGAWNYLFKR